MEVTIMKESPTTLRLYKNASLDCSDCNKHLRFGLSVMDTLATLLTITLLSKLTSKISVILKPHALTFVKEVPAGLKVK